MFFYHVLIHRDLCVPSSKIRLSKRSFDSTLIHVLKRKKNRNKQRIVTHQIAEYLSRKSEESLEEEDQGVQFFPQRSNKCSFGSLFRSFSSHRRSDERHPRSDDMHRSRRRRKRMCVCVFFFFFFAFCFCVEEKEWKVK